MRNAKVGLNDHRMIRIGAGKAVGSADALSLHWGSRTWLAQELDKKADPTLEGFETTVVVTHHGCHPQSCHPRYAGDPMNPAFVSNLRDLVVRARLLGPRPCARQLRLRGGRLPGDGQPGGGMCATLGRPWVPGSSSRRTRRFAPGQGFFDTRQRGTLAGDASDAKEDS